jgi:hypothetical protein
MTAELREKWQYCNTMFMVLSYIIEKITGTWLGHFFRERIWVPLEMHSTFLSLADAQRGAKKGGPKLAVGYVWNNNTKAYHPEPYMDDPVISGAGNIISNVVDYAKYMRAMLTMDKTILSEEAYYELRTPRALSAPEYNHSFDNLPWTGPVMYGLAWEVTIYRGYEIFMHDGGITGFGVLMAYIPKLRSGVGIALMANTYGSSHAVTLVLLVGLIDEMLAVPEDDRVDVVGAMDDLFNKQAVGREPDKARKTIYPNAPRGSSLPPPLPLGDYTGEYCDDGYRCLTVILQAASSTPLTWIAAEKVLHVEVSDKAWRHSITLEHVNGNYFLAWLHDMFGNGTVVGVAAAEFQVGVDGKVGRFGIDYESAMGNELIWFEKRFLPL